MKNKWWFPLFAMVLFLAPLTMAQDEAPGDDDSAAAVEEAPGGDLAGAVSEVVENVAGAKEAKAAGDKKGLAAHIIAIIVIILSWVVDLLNGTLIKKKTKALKWVSVILGGLAGGGLLLVTGLNGEAAWTTAGMLFLAGPLAVAFKELGKDVPVLKQISAVLEGLGKAKED